MKKNTSFVLIFQKLEFKIKNNQSMNCSLFFDLLNKKENSESIFSQTFSFTLFEEESLVKNLDFPIRDNLFDSMILKSQRFSCSENEHRFLMNFKINSNEQLTNSEILFVPVRRKSTLNYSNTIDPLNSNFDDIQSLVSVKNQKIRNESSERKEKANVKAVKTLILQVRSFFQKQMERLV